MTLPWRYGIVLAICASVFLVQEPALGIVALGLTGIVWLAWFWGLQHGRREANSEQRLHEVADLAPMMIWMSNAAGHCTWTNQAWQTFSGRTLAQDREQGWVELVNSSDRAATLDTFHRALETRELFAVEFRARRADGIYRWLYSSGMPRFDGTQFVGYLGICTDITEQRRAVESQHSAALGQLTAGVVHDLANILSAVSGSTEFLLRNSSLNPQGKLDCDDIRLAIQRASLLIRQLMNLSRATPKGAQLMDPVAVVENLIPLLRRCVGDHLTITVSANPETPLILCDPVEFEQIILNLTLNARDAMPRGGEILIGLGATPGPEPKLHLRVADTGIGMTKEVLSHVFEPFFTTKDPDRGSGLGLTTVHRIVHACKGRLSVTSKPNVGTEFQLWFPAAPREHTMNTPLPTAEMVPHGNGECMLLVEDDPGVREVLRRHLEDANYTVLAVEDGMAALKILRAEHVDGVLSDVQMPKMSGFTLADQMDLLYPEVPILLMSGWSPERAARQIHLTKPIEPATLLTAVHSALARAPR